jgi:hypothetical protein
MSYEHCEKHDLPATNGCAQCDVEKRAAKHRQVLAETRAKLLQKGIDPEHCTLNEIWAYLPIDIDQ